MLMCHLGRDQQSDDGAFPKRLARFQPMQPLDQNEAVFVRPNENWSLLSDFQNARRDFLNHFRFESLSPLHGNVDLVDWEAFRFEHSFSSVVTEFRPKHQAALAMAPKSGVSPRGGMEAPGTKLHSNDIQLRTASVAIRSLIGNKDAGLAPLIRSSPGGEDWHDPLSTQGEHLLMRWCGAYAIFKVLTGLRDDHVDRRSVR